MGYVCYVCYVCAGDVIEWDFAVEADYTVDFYVAFKTPVEKKKKKKKAKDGEKEKKFNKVMVEPVARVHEGQGFFTAPSAGSAVL